MLAGAASPQPPTTSAVGGPGGVLPLAVVVALVTAVLLAASLLIGSLPADRAPVDLPAPSVAPGPSPAR